MSVFRLWPSALLALAFACTDEKPDDGTTDDVTGTTDGLTDADGDGFSGDEDCSDSDASINPGATEVCNGIDDNCDGVVDEGVMQTFYADADGDGFGDPDTAIEACSAPADHTNSATDCDDTDADVFPGATEVCDGLDNNCDGTEDEGVGGEWAYDLDGDGFGDPDNTVTGCEAPDNTVDLADATDCDDSAGDVFPGALEVCNEIDDNCDEVVDEGVQSTYYIDTDGDGWGALSPTTDACAEPEGYSALPGDCDDSNAHVSPDATEVCNELDDDCDSDVDEPDAADALTWYADRDTDGYGDLSNTAPGCTAPSGYIADNTDCDDAAILVNPGADEICNTIDDDCDGLVDDDDADRLTSSATAWYADDDTDGYGDAADLTYACIQPSGTVTDATDCDDADDDIHPAATEVCNGEDDDCDTLVDDDDSSLDTTTGSAFYDDDDSDGYGNASALTMACEAPAGTVTDNTDCDDSATAVHPTATEVCNSIDDDCDGDIDDDDAGLDTSTGSAFYDDDDSDGYGDASASTLACVAPTGTVTDNTDCDDTRSAVNPAASEVCNGLDDDCDGDTDDDDSSVDASTLATWYPDDDGDGFGRTADAFEACDPGSGHTWIDGATVTELTGFDFTVDRPVFAVTSDGQQLAFRATLSDGRTGAFRVHPFGSLTTLPGCVPNAGGLTILGGAPKLGGLAMAKVTAPQTDGVYPILFASAAPNPDPCGTAVPGLGEVLIDLSPGSLLTIFPTGFPAVFGITFLQLGVLPNDPTLFGQTVYLQALWADLTGVSPTEPLRLTEGIAVTVGH